MISTKLYNNFCFLKVNFEKFHYTDNRVGSQYHYFAYMEKGTSKIVSKDKTIYVKEGDIFYIPKGTGYQSYWYGSQEISFFSYACNDLLASDTLSLDLQVINCPQQLAVQLTAIPTDEDEISTQTIGNFFSTVAKLLPYMEKVNVSETKKLYAYAKKYLNDNPCCSNTQLAAVCNISLPYLYKIFKKYNSESPNICRQKVLCSRAAELLITTDLSIEQISCILEFSSSCYFRKIFKEHLGQTPSEFRKLYSF